MASGVFSYRLEPRPPRGYFLWNYQLCPEFLPSFELLISRKLDRLDRLVLLFSIKLLWEGRRF